LEIFFKSEKLLAEERLACGGGSYNKENKLSAQIDTLLDLSQVFLTSEVSLLVL
jgi:hypothetical protein